jgi:hypothetical protein
MDVSGNWSGTWKGDFLPVSGTWKVAVTQASDKTLTGPLTVEGGPCPTTNGWVNGSINGCKIEFTSGGGAGQTSWCTFNWKGEITSPSGNTAKGTWSAMGMATGVWDGQK